MKKLRLLPRLALIPAVAMACGSTAEIQPKGKPCEGGTKTELIAEQGAATIHGLPPVPVSEDTEITLGGYGLQFRPANRSISFPRQNPDLNNPKSDEWYKVNTNGTRVSLVWNGNSYMVVDNGWDSYEGKEFCYKAIGKPVYERISKER